MQYFKASPEKETAWDESFSIIIVLADIRTNHFRASLIICPTSTLSVRTLVSVFDLD